MQLSLAVSLVSSGASGPLLSEVCAVIYNGSKEEKTARNRREKNGQNKEMWFSLWQRLKTACWENSRILYAEFTYGWSTMILISFLYVSLIAVFYNNRLHFFLLKRENWTQNSSNRCKLVLFDLQHVWHITNTASWLIIFIFTNVSNFNEDKLYLDRWNSFSSFSMFVHQFFG